MNSINNSLGLRNPVECVMSWDSEFAESIVLPNNAVAYTLRDVIGYIGGLPVAQQDTPEWRKARRCIFEAADGVESIWYARIAVLQALQHERENVV
jgi:hypothetical protein